MADNAQPNRSDVPPPVSDIETASQMDEIDRAESVLAHGTVANQVGVMRWGSNYAALITVAGTEGQVTAVYKPRRGERPLWDFPNGTLCNREVASYRVSQALGWQLVPPTVLRDGPHGVGSLQFFVQHNPEINYFSLDDSFIPQLQRYAVLDHLINNADRKGGHLLLDAAGKLWGIDHGLTFHRLPKLRTVIWDFAGQSIEDSLLQPIRRLHQDLSVPDSAVRQAIDPLLSPAEISALSNRAEQLLEQKTYPKPGPGPNYPWPPV